MDFMLESVSLFWIIFIFGLPILYLTAIWRLFEKMGEPGWKIFVPVYNQYIIFKRSWTPGAFWGYIASSFVCFGSLLYWVIQAFSPAGGIGAGGVFLATYGLMVFIYLKRNWMLSKCFGHGFGYFLGITVCPVIFLMILGLGKSQYHAVY